MTDIRSTGAVRRNDRSPINEAMDVVVEQLGVDTAVVLAVDQSDRHLVAVQARGLEEEVLQGFHLPIGVGFAGRIAATRSPAVVHDVRPGVVVNPLILARGVRSMVGVPLISHEALVGVMHVGSLVVRQFGDDDVDVLRTVGDEVADGSCTPSGPWPIAPPPALCSEAWCRPPRRR